MINNWQSILISPTLFGHLTAPLYLTVAALCWRNGRAAAPAGPGPTAFFRARAQRRVWLALALMLLLLGISRQVDLETLITVFGRQTARRQGWYGARRGAQREGIALVLLGTTIAGAALAMLVRRAGAWAIFAVFDTAALCAFVAVRTASLHDIDAFLSHRWGSVTINRLVEISATAFDALAALAAGRRQRIDRRHQDVTRTAARGSFSR